jgi:predicted dehydrogenase
MLGNLHDLEVQVRTHMPWAQWPFIVASPRIEILYHSIHYIDLVRSWLGNPKSVSAKTLRHPATPHLAPTKTIMFFDFGDNMRVLISTNHGYRSGKYDRSFVQWEGVDGAMRGTLGVNLDYPRGVPDGLDCSFGGREWKPFPIAGNWFPDAFLGSMGALQAFVEGTEPTLPSSVNDAFQTMALVEAAYESSEAGGHTIEWE